MSDVIERLIKEEEIKRKILSSTEYIEWLAKFTKKYKVFADNTWAYTPEKISKKDNENVALLTLFFEAIDEWASKNYYYSESYAFGAYYYIKYNDAIYSIGIDVGQGGSSFCGVEKETPDGQVIDFQQVLGISSEAKNRTKKISKKLKKIDELVDELLEEGIAPSAIHEKLNALIKKISGK